MIKKKFIVILGHCLVWAPFKLQGGGKWLVAAAVSLLFSCVVLEVYFGCAAAVSRSSRCCIVCVYIQCTSEFERRRPPLLVVGLS